MKNIDLLRLEQAFKSLNNLKGAKFAYVISKNFDKVQKEINHLKKSIEPSEEIKQYEKDRISLCEKFSEKDEKGQSKFNEIDGSYLISKDNQKEFELAIEELKEKYKKDLEEYNNQFIAYEKLLMEEVNSDFKLINISLKDVPNEIEVGQLDSIKEIVVE